MSLIVIGFVIMRLAMVVLWLRAAKHDPDRRRTASWYAVGISLAQVYWVVLLLVRPQAEALFYGLFAAGAVLELTVPALAERQGISRGIGITSSSATACSISSCSGRRCWPGRWHWGRQPEIISILHWCASPWRRWSFCFPCGGSTSPRKSIWRKNSFRWQKARTGRLARACGF